MDPHDEAARRTGLDGIPRRVLDDGTIMKYDWELPLEAQEDALTGEALKDHIARLIKEQTQT